MPSFYRVGNCRIELTQGNIVDYRADALVLPINQLLYLGNLGTSGAIKQAAGDAMISETDRLSRILLDESIEGGIREGDVFVTTAGNIPVRHIFLAVCTRIPVALIVESDEQMIRQSTKNSLRAADGLRLKSLGFPALGTGNARFPFENSVYAMFDEFESHASSPTSLERIGLVLFYENHYETAQHLAAKKHFTPEEPSCGMC